VRVRPSLFITATEHVRADYVRRVHKKALP
jgi:hypothetical protein